jgi:hypothetical protein
MRFTVPMPESVGPRDQVAAPDAASIPLRLPARFKKTPRAAVAVRPSTAGRRAGDDRMKIRVVVAEDHPVVREGVMRALVHDSAIEVVGAAADGITAMELAHQLEPTSWSST